MGNPVETPQAKESIPDKVKHAAEEIDSLPTDKREAFWNVLWYGVVISFMVFFLEYVVWAPLWNHVILPLVARLR